jgi:radical SAM superfamily enzyme YgiQ (UPF0313 family)
MRNDNISITLIDMSGEGNVFGETSLGIKSLSDFMAMNSIEPKTITIRDRDIYYSLKMSRVAKFISDHKPHLNNIVGISSLSQTLPQSLVLAREIKYSTDGFIILGGIGPTSVAKDIIENYPFIDAICIGEGEQTIVELANKGSSYHACATILGLMIRDNNGNAVFTGSQPFIQNLDLLSIPYHSKALKKRESKKSAIHIEMSTARGCPGNCSYCASKVIWNHKIRMISSGRICRLLKDIAEKHYDPEINVYFQDATFVFPEARLLSCDEEIKKNGLTINWSGFARLNDLNKRVITLMRKSGCSTITIGIENPSPKISKLMRKPYKAENAINILKMCINAGIQTRVNLMWGWPGESFDDFCFLMEYAFKLIDLGILVEGIGKLLIYPGTELHKICKNQLVLNENQKELIAKKLSDANEIVLNNPDIFPNFLYHDFVQDFDKKVNFANQNGLTIVEEDYIKFAKEIR